MCTTNYLWYIPKHNQVIQDQGIFAFTGVFEDRETAIEYLARKDELPADLDDIVLLRTDDAPVGEATDLVEG